MDIEDSNALFDIERVKRELALKFAQQCQLAFEAYTNSDRNNLDTDQPEITLIALQQAVAELIVQNNRSLWHAVQQFFDTIIDDGAQS